MAGRRANNEGSITRRADGRWVARITLAGGRRKCFYAKTRQEASKLLTAALREYVSRDGVFRTLREPCKRW
jgi:hypothetical protein